MPHLTDEQCAESAALRASRDKLAGLLREARDGVIRPRLNERIDAALAEAGRDGGSAPSALMDANDQPERKP